MDARTCNGNKIPTASGLWVDFLNPDPATFATFDISCGLLTSRYSQQLSPDMDVMDDGEDDVVYYTVSQHSLFGAFYLIDNGREDIAGEFLFHDASEAYTGDINKPLKLLCPGLVKVENRLQAAIGTRFGMSFTDPMIKRVDHAMLRAELKFLKSEMNPEIMQFADHLEDLGIELEECWSKRRCFDEFLYLCDELGIS